MRRAVGIGLDLTTGSGELVSKRRDGPSRPTAIVSGRAHAGRVGAADGRGGRRKDCVGHCGCIFADSRDIDVDGFLSLVANDSDDMVRILSRIG